MDWLPGPPAVSSVTPMNKNIIICSDGTGNSGGKTRGTNVWRIFNALHRHDTNAPQVTHYDDGVGTDTLRWLRLLGGAFGFGISRNLRQLYSFLTRNYNSGDKVYLFGFSRGAFTVRSLAGMVCRCGLLEREWFLNLSPQDRYRAVAQVLLAYRSAQVVPSDTAATVDNATAVNVRMHYVRKRLGLSALTFRTEYVPIHFIGVWDTVDAVGMPFDDLKLIDWLSRRLRKRRLWGFHDQTLSRQIHHAYQALSLDDERLTFHPNVWSDPNTLDAKAGHALTRQQVWFAGSHSNVGGGYPKDALSLIPLDWMMEKAERHGLAFVAGRRKDFQDAMDAHGRLYDSRTGVGMFYRYAPRNLRDRPARSIRDDARLLDVLRDTLKTWVRARFSRHAISMKPESVPTPYIHVSVLDRITQGTEYYAPKVIGFPEGDIGEVAEIVRTDGEPYAQQRGGETNGSDPR